MLSANGNKKLFLTPMAFEFHNDLQVYFRYQTENAEKYVIPFIEEVFPLEKGMRVLEIGCAEGGVLKAFMDHGCHGTGVELVHERYENAHGFLKEYIDKGQCELYSSNIYDEDFIEKFKGQFDLIVMKDVIEHIHDQEKLMRLLPSYLTDRGQIYFGFPPWYMPFGGHQQIAHNKWLSKLPYYHLLPMPLYKGMLKAFGESEKMVEDLAEIKETGISLERFERIVKKTDQQVTNKCLYLINPIYEYKFGLKPRTQVGLIKAIPFFRNFLTTCGYYLVAPVKK